MIAFKEDNSTGVRADNAARQPHLCPGCFLYMGNVRWSGENSKIPRYAFSYWTSEYGAAWLTKAPSERDHEMRRTPKETGRIQPCPIAAIRDSLVFRTGGTQDAPECSITACPYFIPAPEMRRYRYAFTVVDAGHEDRPMGDGRAERIFYADSETERDRAVELIRCSTLEIFDGVINESVTEEPSPSK